MVSVPLTPQLKFHLKINTNNYDFHLRLIRLSKEHIEDGDIFYERNIVFSFKIGIGIKGKEFSF